MAKRQSKEIKTISYHDVESRVIELRGKKVILDSDIAQLYQVETKRINEAVKNNPDKFPQNYLMEINKDEKKELVENFDRFKQLKHSAVSSKAFTEQGLYMLATILKSPVATQTTLLIIDTFTKLREIKHIVAQLPQVKADSPQQKSLMQQAGNIISELIVPDDDEDHESEASIELNLALVKFKYSVKKGKKKAK